MIVVLIIVPIAELIVVSIIVALLLAGYEYGGLVMRACWDMMLLL